MLVFGENERRAATGYFIELIAIRLEARAKAVRGVPLPHHPFVLFQSAGMISDLLKTGTEGVESLEIDAAEHQGVVKEMGMGVGQAGDDGSAFEVKTMVRFEIVVVMKIFADGDNAVFVHGHGVNYKVRGLGVNARVVKQYLTFQTDFLSL